MKYYIGASKVITCNNSNEVIENGYVKIENERIIEVGSISNLSIEEKQECRYYEDCTILPGLINAHEHLVTKSKYTPWTLDEVKNELLPYQTLRAQRNAIGLLRDGVTTIRECGCRERINISMSKAVKRNLMMGPDIVACGRPISIIGGHCYYYSWQISSTEEVVKAVRTELMNGADFIKVHATGGAGTLEGDPRYPQLTLEELTAAVKEAHRENKRVCSHAIGMQGIENTILAGVDTLEHGHYLDDRLLEMMCERGTYFVPTLTGYIPLARKGLEMGRPAWMVEKAKVLLDKHQDVMQLVKKYPEIVIAAGTDSSGTMAEEIEELMLTGYTNYEAIIFATRNSADVLGVLNETGTIESNKKANIIVTDGDPLNDIKALGKIKQVIKSGVMI